MTGSVSYDVVCAGPVTLDVTLAGLERLPQPGEELFGSELALGPGAFATIAVGCARLGLRTALVSPRPGDLAGEHLAAALRREEVDWLGPEVRESALTVVFPLGKDRALASYDPGRSVDAAQLASLAAEAVVCGAGDVADAPAGARVYAMLGGAPTALEKLAGVRAVFANEREALTLTGESDAAAAARPLARFAELAVVTLGARGALACGGEELVEMSAPEIEAVDTTGAGDLLAAAFVWADRSGRPLGQMLSLATLYASLSVGRLGAVAGAPTLAELRDETSRRGLE